MDELEYLAHKRRMIALDEWGWYGAMAGSLAAGYFINNGFYAFFPVILVWGGAATITAYSAFWEKEREVFKKRGINYKESALEKLVNKFKKTG